MNETLKAAGNLGAELGAAKAENERLRGLLREAAKFIDTGDMRGLNMIEVHAALSRQAEPLCEYCDGTGDVHRADGEWLGECRCMKEHRAKVAAGDLLAIAEEVGGLRIAANVAQVTREDLERIVQFVQAEPAPAQDEREAFETWFLSKWPTNQLYRRDALPASDPHYDEYCNPHVHHAHEGWQARATRPAQTEQQPSAAQQILDLIMEECRYWHGRDEARRGNFANLYAAAKELANNTALIAQTAPQFTSADESAVRELLAVLNRDGGQHQASVGLAQAAQDALGEVDRLRQAQTAPAQDEREAFDAAYGRAVDLGWTSVKDLAEQIWEAARATRPAQTAPQPVAYADPQALANFEVARKNGHTSGPYCSEWMHAHQWRGEIPLFAAPQPEQSGLSRALRLLTASCNRIEADSEEFEGPDGATVGVPISSWEEFTEALDEARAALSAQGESHE